MDAARLLDGILAYAPAAGRWPGLLDTPTLAVVALVVLAGAAAALYAMRRRGGGRGRRKAARLEGGVGLLKERLRLRLAEPPELFADAVAGPTVGACEAFEADIEEAAKTVLPEAGWKRATARQLLRKRLNGHGVHPGNGLNGSEAACWRQLGALSFLDGTQDALRAYARAAELAPDDPELQMLVGVLYLRSGRLEAAENAFRRQMRLAEGKDGGEAIRYRAGTMLGDVLLAKGAREDALEAYEAARREVLALAEREPHSRRWQRGASVAHDRIGDLLMANGQSDLALQSYRRSLDIAEALAGCEPEDPGWQHDLSVACDRVGEALEAKGEFDGALESYRRGLALAERLMRREPERPDRRWDVSVSLDRIADVLVATGKTEAALAAYRRGLEIAEAVAGLEPRPTAWLRDLAVSFHKIGILEAQCGRDGEARELLEKGRAIIARLARIADYHAQWRADLSKFDAALRNLGP
jgi:tetratricopeptide (TPR) repeat protein